MADPEVDLIYPNPMIYGYAIELFPKTCFTVPQIAK